MSWQSIENLAFESFVVDWLSKRRRMNVIRRWFFFSFSFGDAEDAFYGSGFSGEEFNSNAAVSHTHTHDTLFVHTHQHFYTAHKHTHTHTHCTHYTNLHAFAYPTIFRPTSNTSKWAAYFCTYLPICNRPNIIIVTDGHETKQKVHTNPKTIWCGLDCIGFKQRDISDIYQKIVFRPIYVENNECWAFLFVYLLCAAGASSLICVLLFRGGAHLFLVITCTYPTRANRIPSIPIHPHSAPSPPQHGWCGRSFPIRFSIDKRKTIVLFLFLISLFRSHHHYRSDNELLKRFTWTLNSKHFLPKKSWTISRTFPNVHFGIWSKQNSFSRQLGIEHTTHTHTQYNENYINSAFRQQKFKPHMQYEWWKSLQFHSMANRHPFPSTHTHTYE